MEAALIDQPIRAEVKAAIRRTVEEQYAGKEIVAVDVTRDEDQWGGPLFIVKIVISDNADLADFGSKLGSLARHIRNGLAEVNEYTFPIIRMMPKRDAERLARGSR